MMRYNAVLNAVGQSVVVALFLRVCRAATGMACCSMLLICCAPCLMPADPAIADVHAFDPYHPDERSVRGWRKLVHVDDDDLVFACDSAVMCYSARAGSVRWRIDADGEGQEHVVLVDEKGMHRKPLRITGCKLSVGKWVLIVRNDASIACVDMDSGGERWRLLFPRSGTNMAAGVKAAVAPRENNGRVYVVSADLVLWSIEVETGEVVQRHRLECKRVSALMTRNKRVLIRSKNDCRVYDAENIEDLVFRTDADQRVIGNAFMGGERLAVMSRSQIIVYSLVEKKELWRFNFDRGRFAMPQGADMLGDDDRIYIPSLDTKLYCLEVGRGRIWDSRMGNWPLSSSVLGMGYLFQPTEKTVDVYDAKDGRRVFRLEADFDAAYSGSTVACVSDGELFVACDERILKYSIE